MPPHATYLFKHALVQDAAYGTLLREPRRALHARIAETLESNFVDIAENQPELLARHFTEAGLIEKAAALWGKAGQRSLARSALVEATEQLQRALAQIATLPATGVLRREQITLQVALIHPLMHVKGYTAPETTAAAERARLLIEQAEALGEPPDDPLLLFSVLYSFWVADYVAFNGEGIRELATQFLRLAEKHGGDSAAHGRPSPHGHVLGGNGRDRARPRALQSGTRALRPCRAPSAGDPIWPRRPGVSLVLSVRALWILGYPEAALADSDQAISDARVIGQAAALMYALSHATFTHIHCGDYVGASVAVDELVGLADEKGSLFWMASGLTYQGFLFALTGKAADAVHMLSSGITAYRSTGSTALLMQLSVPYLAKANADLGQFDDAWRCIGDAMLAIETTKERWLESEANRIAGEIALLSSEPEKAEAYFQRALAVARQQQAKSWELRAAMSLARLWRDQGKPQQARELLAPVYSWFTEGFDTRDLKEAKTLLEALVA